MWPPENVEAENDSKDYSFSIKRSPKLLKFVTIEAAKVTLMAKITLNDSIRPYGLS